MILNTRFSRALQPIIFLLALLIPTSNAVAQSISPHFFGQNAWMPDTIGANVLYGKLHTKWAKVSESGAKIVRFGGITADRDMPTRFQYIKMIDSIRANGMEPIIQVPYHNGSYSAAQAAQLVQYINGTAGRNIKYWSIGNEPDLEYSFTSASQVAAYIRPFASAMKAADPTIKILGPETAWYNQSIINGLTTPGGPSDITGTDTAGRYYVDIISFHTYPFNGTQTRQQVISKLTASPGFDTYLGSLSARVASCNIAHGRTGANALQTAVTEMNVNYQNASGDNLYGSGVNSFIGGQFVAEMFGLGMKNGVDIMTMWSVVEGNSTALNIGYIDRTTGNKKPAYHHFQMMADHFSGNYVSSVSSHTNVKVFSSQNSSLTTVMIMNQDSSANYSYALRLNNALITATNALKINVNANTAQMYYNVIPNQSSVLLQFNAQGAIVKKVTYTIGQALANLSPTISVYTPAVTQLPAQPVNSTPAANLIACSGNTTALVATSGTNAINWYATATSTAVLSTGSVFTTPSLIATAATLATWYAGASNSFSASARTPVTVTVNPRPAVSVNSGAICAGGIFTMVPSGAITYTFSSGSPTVSPSSNASYSVTGTSSAGCVSALPAVSHLTVNARPLVTVNSGSVCAGQVFTMVPSGAVSYSFSNGAATVNPVANSSYSVTGTGPNGCVSASAVASVAINAPMITINSGSICEGGSFTMVPSGAVSYTFSSVTPVVSPASSTTYSVTGTDGLGCVSASYAIASVTVHPNPVISVNSGSICAGSTFTIMPSGGSTYTISSSGYVVQPQTSTSYALTGANGYGCTAAAVSSVVVKPVPIVTVSGGSICKGNSYTLTPSGAASYTYSSGSPVVSPNSTTSYSVWGSNGSCISNPAVVVINVRSRKACQTGESAFVKETPQAQQDSTPLASDPQSSLDTASADPSTGIADNQQVVLTALYPNPNSGEFYITATEECKFTLRSISGVVLRSGTFGAGTSRVDISELPAGVYLIGLTNGNKAQFARVLKQ
jgi:hypothetical protein